MFELGFAEVDLNGTADGKTKDRFYITSFRQKRFRADFYP
jgi:hypothetical protein